MGLIIWVNVLCFMIFLLPCATFRLLQHHHPTFSASSFEHEYYKGKTSVTTNRRALTMHFNKLTCDVQRRFVERTSSSARSSEHQLSPTINSRLYSQKSASRFLYQSPIQAPPRPYATFVLIAINTAIFLLGQLFPIVITLTQRNTRYLMDKYWVLKLGFFASQFCHRDVTHFFNNMISLYNIGPRTEILFGYKTTLILYMLSGWITNLIAYQFQSETITLGASAAIFGLVGAVAMYFYLNRRILSSSNLVLRDIQQTVVLNLIFGIMNKRINNTGHILGFILGALLAIFLSPPLKPNRSL